PGACRKRPRSTMRTTTGPTHVARICDPLPTCRTCGTNAYRLTTRVASRASASTRREGSGLPTFEPGRRAYAWVDSILSKTLPQRIARPLNDCMASSPGLHRRHDEWHAQRNRQYEPTG